jgi:hypothetical protein
MPVSRLRDTKEETRNQQHRKRKRRTTQNLSSLPKAIFELDWTGRLPANDCVIANTFCLADHSLLPKEVNRTRAASYNLTLQTCRLHDSSEMRAIEYLSRPKKEARDGHSQSLVRRGVGEKHTATNDERQLEEYTRRCGSAKRLQQPMT